MLPVILGSLGLGAAKHFISDKPRAERQRKLNAEIIRYSPWTGMAPQQVDEPDLFGNLLQFGTTGAMLGQGVANAEAADALNKAQIANLEGGAGASGGFTSWAPTARGANLGVNYSSFNPNRYRVPGLSSWG